MFIERLQQLSSKIEGTLALSIVAQDGIQVESVSEQPDLDLEILAAELMTQVRAISQDHQELSVGAVRHFTVTTDRMILMVTAVSPEYFLLLVLKAGSNAGRARFELRRSVMLFEEDLI